MERCLLRRRRVALQSALRVKMIRIFDIALKDLLRASRDFKTFMFLLIMPIVFTLLFGYAFGGFGGAGGMPASP